jgi:hypothetical protein
VVLPLVCGRNAQQLSHHQQLSMQGRDGGH